MKSTPNAPPLAWLEPGDPFPHPSHGWGEDSPAPGLLAAGGDLSVDTLTRAYRQGIYPWFSAGQPILWWSPDPRMVLRVADFRLHRSLKKTLQRFRLDARCALRIDHDFSAVIHACARTPRHGQSGTWIVAQMISAYEALHAAGLAHSIETWIDGRLAGGLYCTAMGRAVFGESMFAHATDASKIALAALVALCRTQNVAWIDCQQNTTHLASLGAREQARSRFLHHTAEATRAPALNWRFDDRTWSELLPTP